MWIGILLLVALFLTPIWFFGGMSFFSNLLWLAGFALVAGGCSALLERMKDD